MAKDSGQYKAKAKPSGVLEDAIAEYDSVLAGRVSMEDAIGAAENRKGANLNRRRNVLGRGLSALMSANAVQVESQEARRTMESDASEFEFKAAASLPETGRSAAYNNAPAQGGRGTAEVFAGVRSEQETPDGGLVYLSVDRVVPSVSQPRQKFNEDELRALSESITESGLLQPIIVRKSEAASGPLATYEIVAGERRWRAAKLSGLSKIPALVRHLSNKECLELGIIENVQRADLNPIEEAQAYQRLITEFGATQEQVAKIVGRERTSITNALRLLKLPLKVQEALIEGFISAGHGRALLQLVDLDQQNTLSDRAIKENLSVRALEREVRAIASGVTDGSRGSRSAAKTKTALLRTPAIIEVEERLRRALGTKVSLNVSEDFKGSLQVSFYSEEELERLLERLEA